MEDWHELHEIEAKRKECFDFVSSVESNVLILDAIVKELRDAEKPNDRIARNELMLALGYLDIVVLMLNDAVDQEIAHLIKEVTQ